MRRQVSFLLAMGVGAALFSAAPAGAEGFAYDLAGEMMSPYCPGRTVASCPSPQAAELIQWMSTQEAAGATEEEVVEMLIDRFGEEILGAPPAEGITLWAYIFPVAGFILFGGIAVIVLRRIVVGTKDAPNEAASGAGEGAEVVELPRAAMGAEATDTSANGEANTAAYTEANTEGDASDAELERQVEADLAGRR